jgi:phage repressor protein C with HTH and peptisase S24 domain
VLRPHSLTGKGGATAHALSGDVDTGENSLIASPEAGRDRGLERKRMLAHDEVWSAIDTLAERHGLSPSGLARRSGLDPTTFNKSKRFAPDGRPRWPSTESIAKILAATNTPVLEFFGEEPSAVTTPGPSHRPEPASFAVPLLGEAHAGFDAPGAAAEDVVMAPHPARIISFPDRRHQPLYALSVVGDSMQPLYRDGDVLFVSPNAEAKAGDRVVVKLKNNQLAVKILQDGGDGRVSFHAVNPEHHDASVGADNVEWMAKIVYATQ